MDKLGVLCSPYFVYCPNHIHTDPDGYHKQRYAYDMHGQVYVFQVAKKHIYKVDYNEHR